MTTPPPSDGATTPPLSQIPPPTMTQPVRSPKTPSDSFRPLSLTGAAAKHAPTGASC